MIKHDLYLIFFFFSEKIRNKRPIISLHYSMIIMKLLYGNTKRSRRKKHTLQLLVDADRDEVQQWFLFYFAL